ncbi:FAD/NAD-P-binding domain-containing protein [Cubamyces sp. BRFM 1775]|nr:FAD/NAD-P-binding domain-containing protein [Cubamyces sp. BRFM 1775]
MEHRRPQSESIAVIGAGVAGLITAHTLLRDGFENLTVLTRDSVVGGVWAPDMIYPGLHTNNVHGEYRFSSLEMPAPAAAGARLTGDDMAEYLEAFASKFLQGRIEFGVEVSNIRRCSTRTGWQMDVYDRKSQQHETRAYVRLVVCTGGCSTPRMPTRLDPHAATAAGFKGLVFHSIDFGHKLEDLMYSVPRSDGESTHNVAPIIVIGGGKSAQDISAYVANEGRKVIVVCSKMGAFTASRKPLPDFVRKSRLSALFSPHIHLRTALERLLHTTWLGKKIVNLVWRSLQRSSYEAFNIPKASPLRNTVSLYWHVSNNDEGIARPDGFHALAVSGKIKVITPAHAVCFSDDGRSVVLDDGQVLDASAVVLATGYTSSWTSLFEEKTIEELGLNPHPANNDAEHRWNYTTLSDAPPLHPNAKAWSSSVYRGLVPAKSIANRDLAVNGACVSPNNGYTAEVASHWISSYFLGDEMRLPKDPAEAFVETERVAAWLKRRHPEVPTALNPSCTGYLAFWTWPQHVDDLLEDMGLPVMRSGGNALTWPFKVIDIKEIKYLKEERDARRG